MTKVSALSALVASEVLDPADVLVLTSDGQDTLTSKAITVDELGKAAHYRRVTITGHGLTNASVGKPLYYKTVWNDTVAGTWATWILVNVIDVDTLLVATDGAYITLPVSLIQDGNSYDPDTDGYAVWWDNSVPWYRGTKPADSLETADPILIITEVGATHFKAIVTIKGGVSIDQNIQIVRGTGVAAVDTAAFEAAKVIVEAASFGAIGISGKVILNADQNFTKPISLFGVLGTNPEIELVNTTTIWYNQNFSPFSMSTVTLDATAARQSHLKLPTGTLAQGQWFIVAGDNTISGVTHSSGSVSAYMAGATASASADTITYTSHGLANDTAVFFFADTMPGGLTVYQTYWVKNQTANTFQVSLTRGGAVHNITSDGTVAIKSILASCPMEIHQCKEIREVNVGGFDYIVFDDFIVDALTLNPRLIALTPMENITVKDIQFSWSGTNFPTNSTLYFANCVNVQVRNCIFLCPSPNEVFFHYCGQVSITDCFMEHRQSFDEGEGYGVIAGVVNRMLFADTMVKGCRHAFSTSASTYQGARYGTPRNVVVSNVLANQDGDTGSSLIAFDTHAEGWGIVFQSCISHVPYDPRNPSVGSPTRNTNTAFQSRSRHTVYKGCHAFGSGLTFGFRIEASDNRIEYCVAEDGWRGIHHRKDSTFLTSGCDRLVVMHSAFHGQTGAGGAGILLANGNGHIIAHSDFETLLTDTSSGGVDPSCIFIGEGTGHKIRHNAMNKTTNKYCIGGTVASFTAANVEIIGNSMKGYDGVAGVTAAGFSTSNSDYVNLQLEAQQYNWVSPARKDNTDTLVFATNLAVDFATGSYDNKEVVATANLTAPTFVASRKGLYIFAFKQNAAGGWGITWPANVVFKGASEQPNLAASKTSCFLMYYDGTEFITTRV